VRFTVGDNKNILLNGFTITNGYHTHGGGILCSNSSPMITNNIISNNTASWETQETGKFDGMGGGILFNKSSAVAVNNIIKNNSASNDGGGVVAFSCNGLNIKNNLVIKNIADNNGGGISIKSKEGMPQSVVNNTIYDNKAGNQGGGLHSTQKSEVLIANCIIWKNSAAEGSELNNDDRSAKVEFCDIQGGWPGPGNINSFPIFINPNNENFHLSRHSPCINRASDQHAPLFDFEGDNRPIMGTADMGYDEYTGTFLFECDSFVIPESTGAVLSYKLNGGPVNAGRLYMIFGSASGANPGTPLKNGAKKLLPINWDMFTNIVANLNYPESIVFVNFYGSLDSNGNADASFSTCGPVKNVVGYELSFAYALQGPPWNVVSNPVTIQVIP